MGWDGSKWAEEWLGACLQVLQTDACMSGVAQQMLVRQVLHNRCKLVALNDSSD